MEFQGKTLLKLPLWFISSMVEPSLRTRTFAYLYEGGDPGSIPGWTAFKRIREVHERLTIQGEPLATPDDIGGWISKEFSFTCEQINLHLPVDARKCSVLCAIECSLPSL